MIYFVFFMLLLLCSWLRCNFVRCNFLENKLREIIGCSAIDRTFLITSIGGRNNYKRDEDRRTFVSSPSLPTSPTPPLGRPCLSLLPSIPLLNEMRAALAVLAVLPALALGV